MSKTEINAPIDELSSSTAYPLARNNNETTVASDFTNGIAEKATRIATALRNTATDSTLALMHTLAESWTSCTMDSSPAIS
jgi:predicted porin